MLRLSCVWIVLYTIGHVFLVRDIDIITGIKSMLHGLAGGYYYYNHLWYLYITICLYILTPFLYLTVKNEKILNYSLVIWFVASIIIPFYAHFLKVFEPNVYFDLNFLGGI